MSPSPVADHKHAELETTHQLRPYLPDGIEVLPDMDIDLELAPPDAPAPSDDPT
ncbi:hypothetical protein [Pseudonocardia sp. 73-21]|uniref:hypothetical protein n=1 Tax=Pseudonocardia sp. 73-21 TaxID=1895809 RepID=UPI00260883CD|nr:hypothetical protein [Pseudonocardia sp. 73-21]